MTENPLPQAPAWVRLAAAVIAKLPMGRYRAINRICRRPPPVFLMPLPVELGGYSFLCDLRDGISREVCFTGHYEPVVTAIVRETLKPGMTFVDVGANWGYFTLLAAGLVGRSGQVLALEPDPRLVKTLSDNVTRSGLEQVTVLPFAAGAEAGTLTLAGYDEREENFGLSRIIPNGNGSPQTFQVKADSLDNILAAQNVSEIDLLKMDIEGAEGLAIAGLQRSLAQHKVKRLLLELHPAQLVELGGHHQLITNQLQAAGYQGWNIDHSPTAIRRAAYHGVRDLAAWIHPFNPATELDPWTHQLWLAPSLG
ncbi:MAG TPA: FkbM family methyltransferase [Pyrinomonadaceae bacterium]|nr:FkbM family methyltransferase [Pyrinomonadaceae bacterium]